jgi:hypothetical protein
MRHLILAASAMFLLLASGLPGYAQTQWIGDLLLVRSSGSTFFIVDEDNNIKTEIQPVANLADFELPRELRSSQDHIAC